MTLRSRGTAYHWTTSVVSNTYSMQTCTVENSSVFRWISLWLLRADGPFRIYRRHNESYKCRQLCSGTWPFQWTWIHHDGRTALVRVNGALNSQISRDEKLHHHDVPLINATCGIFQLINVRPHTTRVCWYFLQQNLVSKIGKYIRNRAPLDHPEISATNTSKTVIGFFRMNGKTPPTQH